MPRRKSEVFECDGCGRIAHEPTRAEKGAWLSMDAANSSYARESAALACGDCQGPLLQWLSDRKRKAQDKAFMEKMQKAPKQGPYR